MINEIIHVKRFSPGPRLGRYKVYIRGRLIRMQNTLKQ